jgi:hypothetical protein
MNTHHQLKKFESSLLRLGVHFLNVKTTITINKKIGNEIKFGEEKENLINNLNFNTVIV